MDVCTENDYLVDKVIDLINSGDIDGLRKITNLKLVYPGENNFKFDSIYRAYLVKQWDVIRYLVGERGETSNITLEDSLNNGDLDLAQYLYDNGTRLEPKQVIDERLDAIELAYSWGHIPTYKTLKEVAGVPVCDVYRRAEAVLRLNPELKVTVQIIKLTHRVHWATLFFLERIDSIHYQEVKDYLMSNEPEYAGDCFNFLAKKGFRFTYDEMKLIAPTSSCAEFIELCSIMGYNLTDFYDLILSNKWSYCINVKYYSQVIPNFVDYCIRTQLLSKICRTYNTREAILLIKLGVPVISENVLDTFEFDRAHVRSNNPFERTHSLLEACPADVKEKATIEINMRLKASHEELVATGKPVDTIMNQLVWSISNTNI